MKQVTKETCRLVLGVACDSKMISLQALNEANDLLFFGAERIARLVERNKILQDSNDKLRVNSQNCQRLAKGFELEAVEANERLEQAQATIEKLQALLEAYEEQSQDKEKEENDGQTAD